MGKLKKEKLVNFVLNDLSIEEQELWFLRSYSNEMEEEYIERLEKLLYRMSTKLLLKQIKKTGNTWEDIK
jgi:hypothetical protein